MNHKQNCTSPENIKYHCVINELENAFIEVCAPKYRINGTCSGVNKGKLEHININDCKCYHLNYFCFLSNFMFIRLFDYS